MITNIYYNHNISKIPGSTARDPGCIQTGCTRSNCTRTTQRSVPKHGEMQGPHTEGNVSAPAAVAWTQPSNAAVAPRRVTTHTHCVPPSRRHAPRLSMSPHPRKIRPATHRRPQPRRGSRWLGMRVSMCMHQADLKQVPITSSTRVFCTWHLSRSRKSFAAQSHRRRELPRRSVAASSIRASHSAMRECLHHWRAEHTGLQHVFGSQCESAERGDGPREWLCAWRGPSSAGSYRA